LYRPHSDSERSDRELGLHPQSQAPFRIRHGLASGVTMMRGGATAPGKQCSDTGDRPGEFPASAPRPRKKRLTRPRNPRRNAVFPGAVGKSTVRPSAWWRTQANANPSPSPISLINGKIPGIWSICPVLPPLGFDFARRNQRLAIEFPTHQNRELFRSHQGT